MKSQDTAEIGAANSERESFVLLPGARYTTAP
jgi:hypothetical protein